MFCVVMGRADQLLDLGVSAMLVGCMRDIDSGEY